MKLADFPQIQALSVQEKVELIDELWQSISPELEDDEVSEREKQIFNQRWEIFLSDPSRALTEQEFFGESEASSRR